MSGNVELELFGEPILRRRLLRMGRNVGDGRDALRRAVNVIEDAVREVFSTSGASGGARWEPLAPSTVAQKRRAGLRPEILRATDHLYESLFGGADHVEELTDTTLRWGSRVAYGVYHQSRAPRRRLPWRPIRLNAGAKRKVVKVLQRALMTEGVD